MKKIIVSFLLLVILCGCSGGEITPYLRGIAFRGEMTYYNESYSFLGSLSKEGELSLKMTAPDSLAEMVFTLNGEGTVAEYKGITYRPVEGSMPFAPVIDRFYGSLSEIMQSGETADKTGVLKHSGENSCTLKVAPSGLPQSLEVDGDGFFIDFYNIKIIEE